MQCVQCHQTNQRQQLGFGRRAWPLTFLQQFCEPAHCETLKKGFFIIYAKSLKNILVFTEYVPRNIDIDHCKNKTHLTACPPSSSSTNRVHFSMLHLRSQAFDVLCLPRVELLVVTYGFV